MIETLVIPGVDTRLLEQQRRTLVHIQSQPDLLFQLSPYHQNNIIGLLNMLDYWADAQYEKEVNRESHTRKDEVHKENTE